MTTKAIDTWMNAKPEDQKFLLCELGICSEWVREDDIGGFTKADNRRYSLVVKAARTLLKQIADGKVMVTTYPKKWLVTASGKTVGWAPKTKKTPKKGAKK